MKSLQKRSFTEFISNETGHWGTVEVRYESGRYNSCYLNMLHIKERSLSKSLGLGSTPHDPLNNKCVIKAIIR